MLEIHSNKNDSDCRFFPEWKYCVFGWGKKIQILWLHLKFSTWNVFMNPQWGLILKQHFQTSGKYKRNKPQSESHTAQNIQMCSYSENIRHKPLKSPDAEHCVLQPATISLSWTIVAKKKKERGRSQMRIFGVGGGRCEKRRDDSTEHPKKKRMKGIHQ